MKYQKKYNRQKVIITLILMAVLVGFVLLIGFVLGPSMISDPTATATVPPKETLAPVDGEPEIEDEALAAAIRNQLGITGEITKAHMESLEVLDYTDQTVTDLYGLQYAINLKELRLKVEVTDIEAIMGLNIEKLTFVSDVSVQPMLEFIKEMKYLKYLDLTDCGISTLGYLSELPMLETLILDNNRPKDLEYVAGIKSLSTLSMRNCGINDISDFANNKSIKIFHVEGNDIKDFTALDTMYALKEVTK